MAAIIDETWFIAVLAVVGAVILILIMVIVILCCLWRRKGKKDEESNESGNRISNNNYQDTTQPSNDLSNSQNWVLVYPGDKSSAPASSDTTARVIRGNEPVMAGSSLVYMNKEMTNGVPTQSTIPTSLEMNNLVDAFDRNEDLGYGSEVRPAARISRSELRESEVRKPRITNVSVSKKNQSHMVYNADKNTTVGPSMESPQVANVPYRIPEADYENAPALVMYSSSEERTSWQTSYATDQSRSTKVRGIANAFENPSENNAVSSPTRVAVQSELKKLQQREPIKRRLSQRNSSNVLVQKRASNPLQEIPDNEDELEFREEDPDAWKRGTGENTIKNRLKRYKKAGAMSVFPD